MVSRASRFRRCLAPNPDLRRFVQEDMGRHSFPIWSRAAREIARAYRVAGSPLQALQALVPPVPVLHQFPMFEVPDAMVSAIERFVSAVQATP